MAAPALDVRLPVIAATLQDDQVSIRFVDGLRSYGPAAATRSVTLEAFDAQGKRVAGTSIRVSSRLTYAHAPLTPLMKAASRIVVEAH